MEGFPVMQLLEVAVPPPRHSSPLVAPRLRKYVVLCSVCGGVATALGGLFLAVYLVVRSYTSSLDYFETIPTYIPAAMLLVTGLGIMCLARRRNRYAFLIKLCGLCCLVCAGLCVLVTVTTTVIHMSRLQSLRECVYTIKTHTCTCYSILLDTAADTSDDGAYYVFNSTPDCEVIHGALYSCLRAMFGLSVVGILVCIFCCMLVYQLLSHERKKMYWEQLELRCRYLYGQGGVGTGGAGAGVVRPQHQQRCSHCPCSQHPQQYFPPLQQPLSQPHPFDTRLWGGGRIGNLYSPPPEDGGCEGAETGGWGWRLPWGRGVTPRGVPASSPDSQYGFSAGQSVATVSSAASYSVIEPWGPPPPYSDPNSPLRRCLKRREATESEVYFADVSSASVVLYDEPGAREHRRIHKIEEESGSGRGVGGLAPDAQYEALPGPATCHHYEQIKEDTPPSPTNSSRPIQVQDAS